MFKTKKMLFNIALMVSLSLIILLYSSFKLIDVVQFYRIQNDVVQETVVVKHLMKEEVNCLAENIYYEAGNESYEGKLAVAQVTLNRLNSGKYPNTICKIVKQKQNGICQFSWNCIKISEKKNRYSYEECEIIAEKALTQPVMHDRLAKTNALFYHADYVTTNWNKSKVVSKIGRHIFYTDI
jgi:spore germination cell wall hydrolase CwlJ-like protein